MLRQDVTEAIRAAVFEELAAVGYARMSIEGIARRAGVGKAAIYRRWRSKLRLVLEVVSAVAAQGFPAPDTGSLTGDIRTLLEVTSRTLQHPRVRQILPDLLAEAARTPDIADALQTALRDTLHSVATAVLQRAAERGELPRSPDPDLALDLISGPLYWRIAMARTALPTGYLDSLADATAAALAAAAKGRRAERSDPSPGAAPTR